MNNPGLVSAFDDSERAVAAIEQMDHAEFDARLVLLTQHYSNWTKSELPEHTPNFTVGHVCLYIQRRLAKVLIAQPGMEKQRLTDDRIGLQYVAYEIFERATHMIHLCQQSMDECAEILFKDFSHVLKKNEMTTRSDSSPLWGKENGRIIKGLSGNDYWQINLNSGKHRWDLKLIEHLAGGIAFADSKINRIRGLIVEAVPYMASLEASKVCIHAREVRQNLHALLKGKLEFTADLRAEVVDAMIQEWFKESSSEASTIEKIEREYALPIYKENRVEELRKLPEKTLDSMLRTMSLMPRGSIKDKINTIIAHEARDLIIRPEVLATEMDAESAMQMYFGEFAKKETVTDAEKKIIESRLPIFQWHTLNIISNAHDIRRRYPNISECKHHEKFDEYDAYVSQLAKQHAWLLWIEKTLQLKRNQKRSLNFTQLALASYGDDVSLGLMRTML